MIRTITAAAAAGWLAACTWNVDMRPDEAETEAEAETETADDFFVEAELFYPERIALPGDAELLVAVDSIGEAGRETLTRFSSRLGGRQVPIPLRFSVEPRDRKPSIYELSAAIVSGDRLLRLTGPVLVMPDRGFARLGRVQLHTPLETGFGQARRCNGSEVMFGSVDGRPFLAVDGRVHRLEPVPAASGARYRSISEPGLGLHEKGGEILLLRGEDSAIECRPLEALSPPLSARGNEPGWHVEIAGDRIELVSDYGQTVTRASLLQSGASGRSTQFRGLGDHGPILAAFDRSLCRDSATGMPYPYSVEVQFEGGTLAGCGGRPRDLLTATSWRVERLGERSLPDHAGEEEGFEVTLKFDEEGRLSGRAPCNRYTAGYALSGEGLSIDAPAATRMACAEPRMGLENRFFELLAGVARFDIGENGELILIGPEGRITAVESGAPAAE